MEKPIVFLSHSSKNKAELAALKELLDQRAAGSIEFFLSSDGQSIRFGRNWVVSISDALNKARLMFVFLSAESVDSRWIYFEAGTAYSRDIEVVPVCLPGFDLKEVGPPLSLLQGFNLHSYGALSNIARQCNEVFELRMNESFSEVEFTGVFTDGKRGSYFGKFGSSVGAIQFRIPTGKEQLTELKNLCLREGLPCHDIVGYSAFEGSGISASWNGQVELEVSALLLGRFLLILERWRLEMNIETEISCDVRVAAMVLSRIDRTAALLGSELLFESIDQTDSRFRFRTLSLTLQTDYYGSGSCRIGILFKSFADFPLNLLMGELFKRGVFTPDNLQ
jgi:hypothetical protein